MNSTRLPLPPLLAIFFPPRMCVCVCGGGACEQGWSYMYDVIDVLNSIVPCRHKSDSDLQQSLMMQAPPLLLPQPFGSPQQIRNHKCESEELSHSSEATPHTLTETTPHTLTEATHYTLTRVRLPLTPSQCPFI